MSSNTPNYSWIIPTIGSDVDIWGIFQNATVTSQDTTIFSIQNNNIGTSTPTIKGTGTMWLKNTSNPYPLNIWDGTQWVQIGLLDINNHSFVIPTISSINIQLFNVAGIYTYTPSLGLIFAIVEIIGGGGGGGGCASFSNFGCASSGAGSGAWARSTLSANTIGTNQTIVIGRGGLGGADGNSDGANGGTTSFGTLLTALGGYAGKRSTPGASIFTLPGNGGDSATGDIVQFGNSGGPGFGTIGPVTSFAPMYIPGYGATSYYGGGAQSNINTNGSSGKAAGSGGSGASTTGIGPYSGGSGIDGMVIVTEFIST